MQLNNVQKQQKMYVFCDVDVCCMFQMMVSVHQAAALCTTEFTMLFVISFIVTIIHCYNYRCDKIFFYHL